MEEIITQYDAVTGDDEFKIFENFYKTADLGPINYFVTGKIDSKTLNKSNNDSTTYRKKGNSCFSKKRNKDSLEWYTKAISRAVYDTAEYGMALGNRAAALVEQEDYLNALADIELCLKSKYPETMRSKVYVRKAECYYNLKMYDQLGELISELEKTHPELKDKLAKYKDFKCDKNFNVCSIVLPEVNNPTFAYATSKIKLMYTAAKGRHVVAAEDIKVADVLFAEKAFAFSPVFNSDELPIKDVCYYCLQQNTNCIPCKTCVASVYCNEECRDSSWEEGHRYECKGMALWHDLGMALPALKCIFKGINSNFADYTKPNQECTKKFGDTSDNYMYFNSLVSNLSKMGNINALVVMSAAIVVYLQKYTDFFQMISRRNELNEYKMYIRIGGLLVRHIAQLSCNSSIIQHFPTLVNINSLIPKLVTKTQSLFNLDEVKSIACGIFPSISMMNHSCKANICMSYIKDRIIVRAGKNIKKGEEIFNNYAIDYKSKPRAVRQKALKATYYFKCTCNICSNASEEYEAKYNCFICYHCKTRIPTITETCTHCNKTLSTGLYEKFNLLFKDNLYDYQNLRYFEEHVIEMERILHKSHDHLFQYYDKLQTWFNEEGNIAKCLHYKKRALKVLAESHGVYSWQYVDYILEEYIAIPDNKLFDMLKLHCPVAEIKIVPLLSK